MTNIKVTTVETENKSLSQAQKELGLLTMLAKIMVFVSEVLLLSFETKYIRRYFFLKKYNFATGS